MLWDNISEFSISSYFLGITAWNLGKNCINSSFSEDFSSRKWQWSPLTFAHSPLYVNLAHVSVMMIKLRSHEAKKKKCLVSGNPTDPPVLASTQNFFRHNLHSVKIGNLHSVSQAPFRFHSVVSVQRQHGKTGAQVNHVVVFFPMYVSGTGTLGNVQILLLALLHSPNIKVNSAIQYLQLVFLKSQMTNPQLSMYTKSLQLW